MKLKCEGKQCSCSSPPSKPVYPSSNPPPKPNSSCPPSDGGGNPYDPVNSSSPTASSSSLSDGTKACVSDAKATNALGVTGPLTFAITRPPYRVFSCDQVIVLNAQTFVSPLDYQNRKVAVFTLSAYMVNQFDSMDAKTMTNHILVENVTDLPDNIYGAPSCLDFTDTKIMNKITICMNSKVESDQIKNAFIDFLKCRLGDNLKEMKPDQIRRVIDAACLGQAIDMKDNSEEAKAAAFLGPFLPPMDKPAAKKFGQYNPAYTMHVPGSIRKRSDDDIFANSANAALKGSV